MNKPQTALNVTQNIAPVDLSLQYQAALRAIRLFEENMSHTTWQSHASRLDFLRAEVNNKEIIKIQFTSRDEWNGNHLSLIGLPIHADGSCN